MMLAFRLTFISFKLNKMNTQARLSPESYQFLKTQSTTCDLSAIRDEINNYVNDIDQVIKSVCDELVSLSFGANDWRLKRSAKTLNGRPAPVLNYNLSEGHMSANRIHIQLDYNGDSFIELIKNEPQSESMSIEIEDFVNSPVYKRYYTHTISQEGYSFRARIPKRQITSKYLAEYMAHLITHMGPLIKQGQSYKVMHLEAA